MRPQMLFLVAIVLGAFMGLATLIAGPLTLLPGLVVWAWLIARQPRFVSASGGLLGFAGAWLLLLGQATWNCAHDSTCVQPNVTPWAAFAAVLLVLGVVLALLSRHRLRHA